MKKMCVFTVSIAILLGSQAYVAERALEADGIFQELAFLHNVRSYACSEDGMKYLLDNGVIETLNKVVYKQFICLFAIFSSGISEEIIGVGMMEKGPKIKSPLPNVLYPFIVCFQHIIERYNLATGESLSTSIGAGLSLYEGFSSMMGRLFTVSGEVHDAFRGLQPHIVRSLCGLEINKDNLEFLITTGLMLDYFAKILELNWQLIAHLIKLVLYQKSFMLGVDVFVSYLRVDVDGFRTYGLQLIGELKTQSESHEELSLKGILLYIIKRSNDWFYRWRDGIFKPVELLPVDSFARRNLEVSYSNLLAEPGIVRDFTGGYFAQPPKIDARIKPLGTKRSSSRGQSYNPRNHRGRAASVLPVDTMDATAYRRRPWYMKFLCCG